MKETILIVMLLVFQISNAQLFGPAHLVSDGATTVSMVRSGDLDGDGYMDIVASIFENVVWYRNIDGMGVFETYQELMLGGSTSFSVVISDINGDTFPDLLVSVFSSDSVQWYENLDGQGNFGSAQLISSNVPGIQDAIAADLDGDSDLDVITNTQDDLTLSWFENLDGQGNFGTQQIVTSTVTNGRSVFAEDIDGDDDMDLVCASYGDSSIVWFENLDGQGTFSAEKIIAPPDVTAGVNELICIDLDGDNDLDVLSAYTQDDRISWYENLDGLGTFGSERIITEIAGLPTSIYAVDLDNDDDIDVISAGADSVEGVVAWYQNLDGLGTYGPQEIVEDNSNGTRSVFSEDIDDDGDNDILTSLWWENTINWHENYTILGNVDFEESLISIYPNPTSNLLTIQNQNGLDIESVSLYDALGRKVMENTESTEAIDISNLTTGIYFIHIATDSGIVTKNVIKE